MKKEDTVKLISAEGFEFVIDKKAAMVSQTIRNMLTSPGHPKFHSRVSILIPFALFFIISEFEILLKYFSPFDQLF